MHKHVESIKKHRYGKYVAAGVIAILLPGPVIVPIIVYFIYRMKKRKSSPPISGNKLQKKEGNL